MKLVEISMFHRSGFVWSVTLVILLALAAPAGLAQKEEERPKVHTDFKFGSFPYSADAQERFADEETVRLIIGFHEGWSVDKYIKETASERVDVLTLADDLEEGRLIRGRSDYNMRPGFPVLRELELAILLPEVSRHAEELTGLIKSHWDEVEEFVSSLEAAREMPRKQVLYQALVGGVLLGGMLDAFYDDKTLLAGGEPRRARRRGEGYYAWMTEGDAGPAHLVRQTRSAGRYQVVSVGTVPEENLRVRIDDLRSEAPVYESEDARKWRIFASVFSRDYLLPYFKSQRSTFISLHEQIRASRYTALAEFIAWYYQSVVADATARLVSTGHIEAPEASFKYAIQSRR